MIWPGWGRAIALLGVGLGAGFLSGLFGIGGGIIRDLMAMEIPFVFRREIYAVAALAGGLCVYYGRGSIGVSASLYLCFAVTVLIRLISLQFDLHLPVIGKREDKKK